MIFFLCPSIDIRNKEQISVRAAHSVQPRPYDCRCTGPIQFSSISAPPLEATF